MCVCVWVSECVLLTMCFVKNTITILDGVSVEIVECSEPIFFLGKWHFKKVLHYYIITINHMCVFMYVQTKLTNTTCTAGTRHSTHCSTPLASVSTTLLPPAHCVCRSPWWNPVATLCPGFETLALAPLSSTLQQLMVRGIQDCLFRNVDNSPPNNQSPKKWTK